MPALTEIANRLGWLSRCIESERAEMKTSADENKDHKIAVRRAFAYNLLDAKSSVNVIYTYLTQALDITRFNDAIDSNDVIAVDNARDMLKRFQKRFIKSLQNFIDIYND